MPDPQEPATDSTPTPDQPANPPVADAGKPDAPLGEAGKRALEAERQLRKEAVARAEAAEKAAAQAVGDLDKAVAAAKAETRKEILAEANSRLLRAEIKAAATGRFANPELAVKLIDMSEFKVADDGTVDTAAITKAIDKVIEDDPYLAIKANGITGSADGGQKGDPTPPPMDMNALLRAAAKG